MASPCGPFLSIRFFFFEVSPSELEDLIRRHSGVLDVAVVGVPDERVSCSFETSF